MLQGLLAVEYDDNTHIVLPSDDAQGDHSTWFSATGASGTCEKSPLYDTVVENGLSPNVQGTVGFIQSVSSEVLLFHKKTSEDHQEDKFN